MPDMPRDLNDHPVRANRGIVTVVVILGIMIVLGLGGLVYGIALKAGKIGQSEGDDPVAAVPVSSGSISNGRDHQVINMVADSGRLYLHVQLADGREAVQVYDSDGKKIYEIITFSID